MSSVNPYPKILGSFALSMMAVVAIIDLRGVPMMASYGFGAVILYSMAAVCFLIPSALICAELATAYPKAGGLYAWTRMAFGDKVGFVAIWLEWINNVVSFPATLSFIAIAFTYIYDPHWAHQKLFVLLTVWIVLWATTLYTCLGIKASSWLDTCGALFGTILPAFIITVLGIFWLLLGHHVQIKMDWHAVIPNLHGGNLAFFTTTLLTYSGMQIIGFHAPNVYNPRIVYPRAIFIAVLIILAVTIFATLSVSIVLPSDQLSLISGLMDGFELFFNAFHLTWALPILAALIILSVLATLNTWFLGPARGLAVAARDGFFFRIFAYTNKHEAPVAILLLQSVIASLFVLVFTYMPDINAGFWLLLDLSAQSTLIMYSLLFASAITLRYRREKESELDVTQIYKIPGKKIGIWIVTLLGIMTCLFALAVSVIPPALVKTGSIWRYEATLLVSNLIFLGIPLVILFCNRKLQKTSI